MFTLGIDSGNQNTKAVLLKDGQIAATALVPTAFDVQKAADNVVSAILTSGGIRAEDIDKTIVTGAGRNIVDIPDKINEVASVSYGAFFLDPNTKIVIDLGAESSRVVRLNDDGSIMEYMSNDKCASGSGTFIETMARTLQLGIEEMGDYSLRHTKNISLVAQCVVFAESEVISLIHAQESVENIAYGIHSGIANRTASMVRHVKAADSAMLTGGPGLNKGLAACLGEETGMEIIVPELVEYVSAIGAASYAAKTGGGK